MTFGIVAWLISWQGSDWSLAFDIGVLAEAPAFLVTFYLFLAFPIGRLDPPAARWLMAGLGVVVAGFFLPWVLFSPGIAGASPLTRCAPACPANALQIGSAPSLVDGRAGRAETYALLAITLATLIVYLARLGRASRPQRRSLAAVAITSLLLLPVYFVYSFAAWILTLDSATVDVLAWAVAATRALVPVGFLIVLLQAERDPHPSSGATRSPPSWTKPRSAWATAIRRRDASPKPRAMSCCDRRPRREQCGCRSTATTNRWRRW